MGANLDDRLRRFMNSKQADKVQAEMPKMSFAHFIIFKGLLRIRFFSFTLHRKSF